MGSFFGHALPGSFFILMGFWWMAQIYKRYFRSLSNVQSDNITAYKSSPVFSVNLGSIRNVKLECHVAVVACTLGIIVEIILAPIFRHGNFFGAGNVQHATMYFFFMTPAIASLISPRISLLQQPDKLCYLLLALAYLVEGLLFSFHLYGRVGLDVLIHTLLVYTVFATVAIVIFEMIYQHSLLLSLLRAYFTVLQGLWFYQAAFFLYPPWRSAWGDVEHGKGEEAHEEMMLAVCAFTWHMAVLLILTLVLGASIGHYYKRKYGFDERRIAQFGATDHQYLPLKNMEQDEDV